MVNVNSKVEKISVIIPFYNEQELISQTIDSVLKQNMECFDVEIVIIDDGSKDDSAKIVKSYQDHRIRYFYKENGGVSSARNYGIAQATGDWIFFLDGDDTLFPNCFQIVREIIAKNVDVNVIVGNHYNENNLFLKKPGQRIQSHKTSNPYLSMWLNRYYPCMGTVLFKKELRDEGLLFDFQKTYYEDLGFWLELFRRAKIIYTDAYFMKYNQDENGLSFAFHPIEKELAYDIPIMQIHSFWHKALLYENLQLAKLWWQGHPEETAYYDEVERKCFDWRFRLLHWIRQKMTRLKII